MLYIVPSRGRPANIRELVDAFDATRTHARLWVCVDHDDPQLDRYQALDMPEWAALWVGERMRLGPTINFYATEYLSGTIGNVQADTELIGFMGDDHRPRTPGWDEALEIKAESGPSVVYGNDLLQGRNLPTAVAMSASIIRRLGYFCPPGMIHLYLDNAWKDIGAAVGRLRYVPEVIIEHVHPVAKKAEWDAGYAEANSNERYAADERAYGEWLAAGHKAGGWREKLFQLGAST